MCLCTTSSFPTNSSLDTPPNSCTPTPSSISTHSGLHILSSCTGSNLDSSLSWFPTCPNLHIPSFPADSTSHAPPNTCSPPPSSIPAHSGSHIPHPSACTGFSKSDGL